MLGYSTPWPFEIDKLNSSPWSSRRPGTRPGTGHAGLLAVRRNRTTDLGLDPTLQQECLQSVAVPEGEARKRGTCRIRPRAARTSRCDHRKRSSDIKSSPHSGRRAVISISRSPSTFVPADTLLRYPIWWRRICNNFSHTTSCSSFVSDGYIGNENISRAADSVSGRSPGFPPRCAYPFIV